MAGRPTRSGEWRQRGEPVVFVRHDSTEDGSPLAPGLPGNELKDVVEGEPDVTVIKSVHSAFHGEPDLAGWLREPAPGGEDRAADLVEAAGGRQWAVAEARGRIAAAEQALRSVPIPAGPRAELAAIAHFIVARES